MENYNPSRIESKWQKSWEKQKLNSPDLKKAKRPFYNLMMFPYPSAEGLHVGNMYAFVHSDCYGRFMRLKGFDVFEPIGLDGFGIHSENFAIKKGEHILDVSRRTEKHFYEQLKTIGNQYDWEHHLETYKPEYYKWTQWIFVQMFKRGLAYQKESYVNWCPSCKTVLSDEQVISGKCERCANAVEKKMMKQWFFRITNYAERLLKNLESMDWSERTKIAQKNWIGKSEGAEIIFPVVIASDDPAVAGEERGPLRPDRIVASPLRPDRIVASPLRPDRIEASPLRLDGQSEASNLEQLPPATGLLRLRQLADPRNDATLKVFTTRLDTIFGCTYCVLAPENKLIRELKPEIDNWIKVEKYINAAKKKSEIERAEITKDKTGVELKGVKAVNPFNNQEIPIFVADYVLGHYGTGAVMAVPAHDERDWEFARKYNLLITQSVARDLDNHKKTIVSLDILKKIYDIAQKRGIKFWVLGGLACAFYAGIIYRNHEDLDLIVKNEADMQKIADILEEIGFKKDREKKLTVKLTNLIYKNNKGLEVDIAIDFNEFGLKEADFEDNVKRLNQFESLVLSKRFIKSFKEFQAKNRGYEKDKIDLEYLNGKVFVDDGFLVNSREFDGFSSSEAREKMAIWLEKNNLGVRKINYKLRDWCISRQRYWGPPIPIIYCEKCGVLPVLEKDLPVLLPKTKDYLPKNDGLSPLARNEKFVKTKCPKCGGEARRETDVSDTFLDSAWYFLRYPSIGAKNSKLEIGPPTGGVSLEIPWNQQITRQWLPVDMYIGGHEHAVLHLLYSRFMTMFFKDLGLINFEEPYKRFFAHGLLISEGAKISKSKGNIINPDEYVTKYGADSMRLYLMFLGDVSQGGDWRDTGMQGMYRFVNRIWKLNSRVFSSLSSEQTKKVQKIIHQTIKKVSDDLAAMKFNTAIAALMILVNGFEDQEKISAKDFKIFIKLLSPFAPHISEELWSDLGNKRSVFKEKWPEYDSEFIKEETIELIIQINGKVRDKIEASVDISEEEAKKIAFNSEKIKNILAGKEPKKIIFVKGRLVNIVV